MFHILVVDDDKNSRLFLAALLEEAGYTVTAAENGEDALEKMDRAHIDLVVLDIMMPNMDGYEFTRLLRESQNNLPILMVSDKQLPADKHKGFDAGIDDYMAKPIEQGEFIYRIKALLRRAKIANERKIIIGDVVLDYDSLTVSRGECVQELPQKEFQLLYKLASFPGKIFTRQQLMDDIWGYDSGTDPHTVDVHIGRLRDRFRDCSDFKIVTMRGVGYKVIRT